MSNSQESDTFECFPLLCRRFSHKRFSAWILAMAFLLGGFVPAHAELRKLKFTGEVLDPGPLSEIDPGNRPWGFYEEIIPGDRFEARLVFDDAVEDINGIAFHASGGGYGEYPGAVKEIIITFFSPEGVRREIGAYAYEGSALIMDRFTAASFIPGQPAAGDYSRLTFAGGRKVGLAPMPPLPRHFYTGLILPGMSSIDITFIHEQRHVFVGKVTGPPASNIGLTLGHALSTSFQGQTLEILNYILHDPTNTTDDNRGGGTITLSQLSPQEFLVKQNKLRIDTVTEEPDPAPPPSCPQIRPRGFSSPVFPGGQLEFELVIAEAPAPGETVSVPLNIFPSGILTAPSAVTFQSGERRKVFTVEILPGNAGKSVTLRAGTDPCYGFFTLGLEQVELPRAVRLEFFPAQVDGGRQTIGLVTFDRPSIDGGPEFLVRFSPEDGGVPPTVSGVLQQGATGAFFNVPTRPRTQTTVYTGQLYVSETETDIRESLVVLAPVQPPLLDSLTLNPAGVRETESSQATVRLLQPAPPGGLNLTLSATTTDVILPPTLLVPAGSHQANFTVATRNVDTVTPVGISASHGTESVSAWLAIFPDAPKPVLISLVITPQKLTDAANAIGTVTLNTSVFVPTRVRLHTFSRDLFVPAEVEVKSGQQSASFPVQSRLVSRETRAVVTATLEGRSASAIVDLDPSLLPRIQSLSVNDPAPAQGTTVMARVQLDRNAPSGGSTILLRGKPEGMLGLQTSVTVQAGESAAQFPVIVGADPLGESYHAIVEATLGNITTTRRFLAAGTDLDQRSTYAAFVSDLFPGQAGDPQVAGPEVIAPGQTLNNAQRYAFGASALLSSTQNVVTEGRTGLHFRFPWRMDAIDLRLAIQTTTDFVEWEDISGEEVGLTISGISADGLYYEIEANLPQTEGVDVRSYRVLAEPLGAPTSP